MNIEMQSINTYLWWLKTHAVTAFSSASDASLFVAICILKQSIIVIYNQSTHRTHENNDQSLRESYLEFIHLFSYNLLFYSSEFSKIVRWCPSNWKSVSSGFWGTFQSFLLNWVSLLKMSSRSNNLKQT